MDWHPKQLRAVSLLFLVMPGSIKTEAIARYLLIGCWLLVSVVALTAMYHLWWTRDYRQYRGVDPVEQRLRVAEQSGIPVKTIKLAYEADRKWPDGIAYRANGSEVTLSYFKYLMIPRVPSGSDAYSITETRAGNVEIAGGHDDKPRSLPLHTVPPTARGLIGSLCVVGAVAILFKRFGFSFPQQVACSTLLLYVLTVLVKPQARSYTPVGVVFCLVGLIGVVQLCRPALRGEKPCPAVRLVGALPLERWIAVVMYGVIAAAMLWSFLMAVVVLLDDWDAWAQWGPKAKLLAVSSGPLSDVRYFVPGSGDYPLLWPSVWAFSGWCAGGWEEQWSKGWGAVFLALTAWQLNVIYRKSGGDRTGGVLLAALFVSMPVVPLVASWAYAEAPYWLMLVCSMSALMAWQRDRHRNDLWAASVFVAAAASTKNEGMMFAVLCSLWVAINSRNMKDIMAVSLLPLVFAGLWRLYAITIMGTSSHALSGLFGSERTLADMAGMLRYVLGYSARLWFDPRQWNVVVPLVLMASLWLMVKGNWRQRMNMLLPVAMLGGLLCVVLGYGENWKWQLYVAWNRLTIQFLVVLMSVLAAGMASLLSRRGQGCPDE